MCVFFQRNILVSPFSIWLGDHVNGGLVELGLKTVHIDVNTTLNNNIPYQNHKILNQQNIELMLMYVELPYTTLCKKL